MSNHTISLNQLTPNTTVLVRGKLAFSRLAKQIDGEELQKDMQRRQQKGWIPIDKPYTTATINNAQLICPNGQKSLADTYVEERFFQSKSSHASGWSYTANNKGKNLPYICEMKGQNAVQIIPESELANGLDVTLVLRVFKGKPNNGLSLDGVIVNEPIRYYVGNNAGAGLADLGITFVPAAAPAAAPVAESAAPAPAPAPAAAPATAPANFPADDNPFGGPVSAPVGNPYATQPAAGMPFGAPQGGFQPAQPQQGIRYNPNSDRPY